MFLRQTGPGTVCQSTTMLQRRVLSQPLFYEFTIKKKSSTNHFRIKLIEQLSIQMDFEKRIGINVWYDME